MSTHASAEAWRHVPALSKVEADRLTRSRANLVQFVVDRFKETFGVAVEDTNVEAFPDGLTITLVADVPPHPKYNVWGHAISRMFADAAFINTGAYFGFVA